ncbi:MAG: hypothetical protein AAF901_12870, partial [Bacteroidota bacterium]
MRIRRRRSTIGLHKNSFWKEPIMDAALSLTQEIIKRDVLMEATDLANDLFNHNLLHWSQIHINPKIIGRQQNNYRWYFISHWLFNELLYRDDHTVFRTPYGYMWAVDESSYATR